MISNFFDILFPSRCRVCRRKTESGIICIHCLPDSPEYRHCFAQLTNGSKIDQQTINFRCSKCFAKYNISSQNSICTTCSIIPPNFTKMRYVWDYETQIKGIITGAKYLPSEALCHIAANMLAEQFHHLFGDYVFDLMIPIPTSKANINKRLFWPTLMLAKTIKKRNCLSVPINLDALKILGNKPSQAALSLKKRILNARNIFQADKKLVIGKRILLIEDVITTGATICSATNSLLKAGASSVTIFALTRHEAWQSYRWRISKEI